MQVSYSKRFLKQLAEISKDLRVKIEQFIFEELIVKASIFELGKIEKM